MKKQLKKLESYKLFYEQIPVHLPTVTTVTKVSRKRSLKRPRVARANVLDNLK